MLVKFTGTNHSLKAYGYRFEKDRPVEVDDSKVLAKLKERSDFEVLETEKPASRKKGDGVTTAKVEEGDANVDTGEGKAEE